MVIFIDRRLNSKGKSVVNRQRFMRRYKKQIKNFISDAVIKRSVTDINSGEKISIPAKDISEPEFSHNNDGVTEKVFAGNDRFQAGDKIGRPSKERGGKNKGKASKDQAESQDSFIFNLSKEEYLNLIFEDLELPNMEETSSKKQSFVKLERSGFVSSGAASNLNIVRSFKNSISRRIAMCSAKKRKLADLEQKLEELINSAVYSENLANELRQEIHIIKLSINKVPFLDSFDLRYNNFSKKEIPSSNAVMFCLMDVSGSMDQATKDIAKRFYTLLYLFLNKSYTDLDIVFIRHHTQAKEVDENDFFYSQETGGTIVSSALKLMHKIQQERYPAEKWNVYVAQASDGDNWADDSPVCKSTLQEKILPYVKYYSYIEITSRPHQTLWREYESLMQQSDNFIIQHIKSVNDIYPVFRKIFKKQKQGATV